LKSLTHLSPIMIVISFVFVSQSGAICKNTDMPYESRSIRNAWQAPKSENLLSLIITPFVYGQTVITCWRSICQPDFNITSLSLPAKSNGSRSFIQKAFTLVPELLLNQWTKSFIWSSVKERGSNGFNKFVSWVRPISNLSLALRSSSVFCSNFAILSCDSFKDFGSACNSSATPKATRLPKKISRCFFLIPTTDSSGGKFVGLYGNQIPLMTKNASPNTPMATMERPTRSTRSQCEYDSQDESSDVNSDTGNRVFDFCCYATSGLLVFLVVTRLLVLIIFRK
jgi:hypothetical protein